MKKSDIYEIAIKILGLYLIIILLRFLQEALTYITISFQNNSSYRPEDFDQTPLLLIIIGNLLLVATFTALLIFKNKNIAKLICSKSDYEESVKLFAEKQTIYEMALVIVGLLMIVITLPEVAFKLKNIYQLKQANLVINRNDINFMYMLGAKIAIGLAAIAYSKRLASKITNVQS